MLDISDTLILKKHTKTFTSKGGIFFEYSATILSTLVLYNRQDRQTYSFYFVECSVFQGQRLLAPASLTDTRGVEVTKPRTKTRLYSLWWTTTPCYEWDLPRLTVCFRVKCLSNRRVRPSSEIGAPVENAVCPLGSACTVQHCQTRRSCSQRRTVCPNFPPPPGPPGINDGTQLTKPDRHLPGQAEQARPVQEHQLTLPPPLQHPGGILHLHPQQQLEVPWGGRGEGWGGSFLR